MGSTKARRALRARTPTGEQFSAYEGAFDYFNKVLFAGTLLPLMLNFGSSGNRALSS